MEEIRFNIIKKSENFIDYKLFSKLSTDIETLIRLKLYIELSLFFNNELSLGLK